MTKESVIGSYLLRIVKSGCDRQFYLHNIKTGEVLAFETWVSVWAFLEQVIEGQEVKPWTEPLD